MLIIVLLLIASFLIVSAALLWDARPHHPSVASLLVWAFVFFLMAFLIEVTSVSAAENSAPAESAITVKGYDASCPTEFNPDDSAWAMHDIKYEIKKFSDDIELVEHRRIFSYFPDAEQRIFVGLKNWKNPACVAELFSYGPTSGINQKRVWGAIRSSDGTVKTTTVFLLTDEGWEKGGADMPKVFVNDSAGQLNIVFALYRDNVQVASRALPIEPAQRYYHFQFNKEPVE